MSYEPRSLNPSIMEKRINDLQKASGGGGFELPIASAETLGGIKVPADSGITIDGSGNAYAYKPAAYSTTEHLTGRKWLDGKNIYEKTYSNVTLLNSDTTNIDTLSGVDNVIALFGTVENNAETLNIRPIPFAAGGDNDIRLDVTSNVLKIITFGSWSSYTANVTIQYTKQADAVEPTEEPAENTEE